MNKKSFTEVMRWFSTFVVIGLWFLDMIRYLPKNWGIIISFTLVSIVFLLDCNKEN